MSAFLITTFYSFDRLSKERIDHISLVTKEFASTSSLNGLLVLGLEGMNATVAAHDDDMLRFKSLVRELSGNESIDFKDSVSPKKPFARFKVDVRPEIVSLKQDLDGELPGQETYLEPDAWDGMALNDRDAIMIDTRNDYEVKIGKFRGAVNPDIAKFSDFPEYVKRSSLPKDKKVMLYCTGGIRCEKAVVQMKRLGFEKVFHLKGGILRYLETTKEGLFEGECFVFDHRVAVDSNLEPSRVYKLCPHCGDPAREMITCRKCSSHAVVCKSCLMRDDRYSCSKNCAYHLRRIAAIDSVKTNKQAVVNDESDSDYPRTANLKR